MTAFEPELRTLSKSKRPNSHKRSLDPNAVNTKKNLQKTPGGNESSMASFDSPSSNSNSGSIGQGRYKLSESPVRPNIFHFDDYRKFLFDFYNYKKTVNPAYSMSVFARRAGLGENSRGYLKLIVENKRNLTPHTVRRFSEALELSPGEALYFENLVFCNQSKNSKDKKYYLDRLKLVSGPHLSPALQLMLDKVSYFSKWYWVAIREVVALVDFKEDPRWIVAKLRNAISPVEASEALEGLLNLGMIRRGGKGQLEQCSPLLTWEREGSEETLHQFHLQMIERAEKILTQDTFGLRDASGVTLSCSVKSLPQIIQKISRFRADLVEQFGNDQNPIDSVIQVNFQVVQLTEPKAPNVNSKSHSKNVKETGV